MAIGSGKIEVRFKADASEKFNTPSLNCNGIEFYGNKICFSDADGDLIKIDGSIIEASMEDIYSIKTK